MSTQPKPNYYAILGLSHTATPSLITSTYRRLALQHHPDKNLTSTTISTLAFQSISLAYETLRDPLKRRDYDRQQSFSSPIRLSDDWYTKNADVNAPKAEVWVESMEEKKLKEHIRQSMSGNWFGDSGWSSGPWRKEGRGFEFGGVSQEDADEFFQHSHEREGEFRKQFRAEIFSKEQKRQEEKREFERLSKESAARYQRMREENAKKGQEEKKMKEEEMFNTFKQSAEEKQKRCGHDSEFKKITLREKPRCESCSHVRGNILYLCRDCNKKLCQVCYSNFMLDKEQMEDGEGKFDWGDGPGGKSVDELEKDIEDWEGHMTSGRG